MNQLMTTKFGMQWLSQPITPGDRSAVGRGTIFFACHRLVLLQSAASLPVPRKDIYNYC
jgi:hypothetical protein